MSEYQPVLFNGNGSPSMYVFRGADLTQEDIPRLTAHLERFIEFVSDGRERSLRQIADSLGMMETSASARWRQIREMGYAYEKRRDEQIKGLIWYRLTGRPE